MWGEDSVWWVDAPSNMDPPQRSCQPRHVEGRANVAPAQSTVASGKGLAPNTDHAAIGNNPIIL